MCFGPGVTTIVVGKESQLRTSSHAREASMGEPMMRGCVVSLTYAVSTDQVSPMYPLPTKDADHHSQAR
jgi:hypothetical protein